MVSKETKVLSIIAAALLGFTSVRYTTPRVLHNVMSNSGFREATIDFTDYLTYFTQGHYRGFVNSIFYGGEKNTLVDPQNYYAADPLNRLRNPLHDVDLNAVYLGLQENPLPKSSYRPTKLSNAEEIDFYSIAPFIAKPKRLLGEQLRLTQEKN